MQPLRYKWFWLGAGLGGLALTLGLALLPMATPIAMANGDKLMHVLAFAVLVTWFLGVVDEGMTLRVIALLAAYGLLIEFLQSFLAYRAADPWDVLADFTGIGIGWLLAGAGLRRWCGWVEGWLGASPE
ncbi:MAG: VanZ family protein [Gammaproteobacteria bacterium]|nr:MAG: VanZ family protein [Gammaproteobacteria bacterium]